MGDSVGSCFLPSKFTSLGGEMVQLGCKVSPMSQGMQQVLSSG